MVIKKQFNMIESIAEATGSRVYFLCGIPGLGKTAAALDYCCRYPDSLYFTFQNLEAALAPVVFAERYPEIFHECSCWSTFFEQLRAYGEEKHPVIFFDRTGDRTDKELFYQELDHFTEECSFAHVILIGRPWDCIPVDHITVEAKTLTMPELADVYSLKDENAAEIFSLTAGLPALLAAYDTERTFDENVRDMLCTDSAFYRLVQEWMSDSFRTPETYNTLLYGMTHGCHRISELARLSGYPQNKADKYIRALTEHGLVRRETGKNRYSRYVIANSYLYIWYRIFLSAVPDNHGRFGEEIYQAFMDCFYQEVLPDFYRELCVYWIQNHVNEQGYAYVDLKNPAYYNVNVGGMNLDFAADRDGTMCCAYFDTHPGAGITSAIWEKIEKATTKDRPYYTNEYYLLTVNRVPDKLWGLSKKEDNVHIVQRKSLFSEYRREYNRIAHPKSHTGFKLR